jgi:hypothetical protein
MARSLRGLFPKKLDSMLNNGNKNEKLTYDSSATCTYTSERRTGPDQNRENSEPRFNFEKGK